jgi:hypothetical protein
VRWLHTGVWSTRSQFLVLQGHDSLRWGIPEARGARAASCHEHRRRGHSRVFQAARTWRSSPRAWPFCKPHMAGGKSTRTPAIPRHEAETSPRKVARQSGSPQDAFATSYRLLSPSSTINTSGQSHLIFGTGSTGRAAKSPISKLCCANALYKWPENLDAIALWVLSTY